MCDMYSDFILGSSSKCRSQLLEVLGFFPKRSIGPEIDESPKKGELPLTYAKRMAYEKALKLKRVCHEENVITADTVASCGRRILPKACCDEDVRYCLEFLSGRRHRLYTSLCLVTKSGEVRQRTVMTVLKFKRLSNEEIEFYLATKEGIGKAGGYSIQGMAQGFVLFIRGSYFNVVGLPAYEVISLLRSVGVFQQSREALYSQGVKDAK
ncbi:maf protein [Neorickettsia sennetsu str. Miyayama]|uniref:Nucleoside triphosphate pyrophosphatase n=2 Tax=Ehrlichia sennetsu TaxID=951 RepID=NTPP_EHRS3|nr:RecName: Full=Nucleoside triphosphate pyrophosphatase; AltName: Full=Nucleotide pyrophosphatase; Short=Nucleotide PPase [Neorickettsia sennetsu str. Miyayama]ABD45846.1 maf protein [Neorickettsia sennetsu str. Miyayama]